MHKDGTRTVLITGCSAGGIGDALAQEFHSRGLRVIATARSMERMKNLEAVGITCLAMDVVDQASIDRAVHSVKDTSDGGIDILVNNAGSGTAQPPVRLCAVAGLTISQVTARHSWNPTP
jgi:1-acylglycerone phosphate reductase